jgi:hypothetical protein
MKYKQICEPIFITQPERAAKMLMFGTVSAKMARVRRPLLSAVLRVIDKLSSQWYPSLKVPTTLFLGRNYGGVFRLEWASC